MRLFALWLLLVAGYAASLIPMIMTVGVLVGHFGWTIMPLFFSALVGGMACGYAHMSIALHRSRSSLDVVELEINPGFHKE